MAAAPLEAEGAEVAANFARFAAALDDTLKVVSKPKEWNGKPTNRQQLIGRAGVFK